MPKMLAGVQNLPCTPFNTYYNHHQMNITEQRKLALALMNWHGGQSSAVYAVASCMLHDAGNYDHYCPGNNRGHADTEDGIGAVRLACRELRSLRSGANYPSAVTSEDETECNALADRLTKLYLTPVQVPFTLWAGPRTETAVQYFPDEVPFTIDETIPLTDNMDFFGAWEDKAFLHAGRFYTSRVGNIRFYDDGYGKLFVLSHEFGVNAIVRARSWEDAWDICEDEFFPAANMENVLEEFPEYGTTEDPPDGFDESYGYRPSGGELYQKSDYDRLDQLTQAMRAELKVKLIVANRD